MSPPTTPSNSSDSSSSGLFQTLSRLTTSTGGASYVITDSIHGEYHITEPLLVHLLSSLPLQRLRHIHQHGITSLLGHGPAVTRLEHSVGAMLLVRRAGGSVAEQAFGLLHDVAHTALSHVVDWALSAPGEDSYHDVHMREYVATTCIPEILKGYGMKAEDGWRGWLDEGNWPLVEQPAPHLCADRLDYALRDAAGFGKLELSEARSISDSVVVFPGAEEPPRPLLCLADTDSALVLGRSYLAMDRDVWSNPMHVDLYRRTGEIIRDVVARGGLSRESLWEMSDASFWEALRGAATPEQRRDMEDMESRGLPSRVETLPPSTKIRTIDPDVYRKGDGEPVPLSTLDRDYGLEREQYICSRRAIVNS